MNVKSSPKASQKQKAKCRETLKEIESKKLEKVLNNAKLSEDVVISVSFFFGLPLVSPLRFSLSCRNLKVHFSTLYVYLIKTLKFLFVL